MTVLEWRWKAWNETSQVSMKQRWGCYVYTYFNASANLLIEISGRKKKSTYYMYELFLNWLINLNEGKINENPIFFLSYRSHFFKVSFFFLNFLPLFIARKSIKCSPLSSPKFVGGVRLKILQIQFHKSEGDTLHSNLSVSRITGSPFIVYSFGYTVNIMPLNIQ